MKNKFTFTKTILSAILMMVSFTFMGTKINASESVPSTIFILSDELVDAGYRMQGCSSDAIQCFYKDNRVIGVELKLGSNRRVVGYPAVNNGKDYKTKDVEFRVNDEVVSNPVYNPADAQYHPKPLNFAKAWDDQTTFVAYFRTATIQYYDHETLLHSETMNVGNDATAYTYEKAEDDAYQYTFDKWVDVNGYEADLTSVQFSTNVYATYTTTAKYDVQFMSENVLIHNTKILEGNNAVINEVPTKNETVSEDSINIYRTSYSFSHWNVNSIEVDLTSYEIHENTVFEAVFKETETITKKTVAIPGGNIPSNPSIPTPPFALSTNDTNSIGTLNTNPTAPSIETINDNSTPLANKVQEEIINENETPLAKPIETTTWSLMNLIFMLLTTAFGFAYLKDNKKTLNSWLSATTFVVSIIIFVTTQDMTATMGYVDSWTIVMALLMLIAIMQIKRKQRPIHN